MTLRRSTGAALIVTAALAVPSTTAVAASARPASSGGAANQTARTAARPGQGDGGFSRSRTPDQTRTRVRVDAAGPADAARQFLSSRRSTYHIADPATDLIRISTVTEKGTTVVRFGQRYRGMTVAGAQYVVRMRDTGSQNVVSGTSGQYFSDLQVDTSRPLSFRLARSAAKHAMSHTRWRGTPRVSDRGSAVVPVGRGVLTRHVVLRGYDVVHKRPVVQEMFIGAHTGKPVLSYSGIQLDGPITTSGPSVKGGSVPLQAYQRGSSYELRDRSRAMYASDGGEIVTRDAKGRDMFDFIDEEIPPRVGPVTSSRVPFPASANGGNDAHSSLGVVYEYYRSLGRNSLDGHGGTITGVVGVTEFGDPFPNAFWNGSYMVFGTGGYGYRPFSSSLDVVGHELTHGVIENSSALVYLGQSGALNEAAADYMGNAIQNRTERIGPNSRRDGLLGEDLCRRAKPVDCALRDMNAPVTTDDFVGDPEDFGEVHANSPIASASWWQVRHSLGADVADPLVYRTVTQYLTPLSQFLDAREATIAAAQDAGLTSAQVDLVRKAFDDHGIKPGWEQSVLGADFTSLHQLLGEPFVYPRLANGRWLVSDLAAEDATAPAILSGSIGGGATTRLSPDDDAFYDNPDSDGATAVWTRTRDLDGRTYVQSKDLDSGTVTTEDYSTFAFLYGVRVSGSTIAYSSPVQNFESDGSAVTVLGPNGTSKTLNPPGFRSYDNLDVEGTQVVFTDTPSNHRWVVIRSYDAATGVSKVLGTFHGRKRGIVLQNLTLTPHRVVFTLDRTPSTARTGIVVMRRDGKVKRLLVDESARSAPRLPMLTATDEAVTYSDEEVFSELPIAHLRQRPTAGGAAHYLSCSRGYLGAPSADAATGGTSAVWVDFSTGLSKVVGRTTPVGSCG